jgi:hypothetical protein
MIVNTAIPNIVFVDPYNNVEGLDWKIPGGILQTRNSSIFLYVLVQRVLAR